MSAGWVKNPEIYQIKVSLRDIKPPIWRRLQVPGSVTLGRLSNIVQTAMRWHSGHLHAFYIDGSEYGDPSLSLDDSSVINENNVKLQDVLPVAGDKCEYLYDFGDSWEHVIVVEKILDPEPGVKYPRCVSGKRNAPPDDSGGVYGYYDLLEILSDPNSEEYEEMREWVGGSYDPEQFDCEEVNNSLGGRVLVRAGK